MMRWLLTSALALSSLACAATPTEPTTPSPPACSVKLWACTSTYGAIAYSPSTGAMGIAYNHGARADADAAAIGFCSKADCVTVAYFSNSCGAIATAPTGQMATGTGNSGDTAQAFALSSCLLK